MDSGNREFGAAAALGGSEFLELRIEQLETDREPPMARVPRQAWAVTVAALVVLSAGFLASVVTARTSMMMNESGRSGPGSTLLGVLGGLMCSVGWVWVGWMVWRHAMRHRTLTLRSGP